MRKLTLIVGPAALALAIALWTALAIFSLWTQRQQLNRTATALAKIDAIANLRKDMAIRKWADTLGGVYVNEAKIPNLGSLDEQERMAVTRGTGENLTLVSIAPIHILLAIQEISQKTYGTKERLTSLQLRNRANAPDEWETNALKALQGGAEMATESMPKKAGGHGLLRVMIPMKMDEECLECHRDTLIPVGGLRGGASISIDLNTYRTAQEPTWRTIQYWHFGIWLLGLTTIYAFWFVARRRTVEQARLEADRRENETAFSAMAEGAVITDAEGRILWVNDAFCAIYGYTRAEVIGQNPRILKSGRHDAAFYSEFWRQLIETGHWRGEVWNKRKTGEIFPEELSIQALRGPDGRIVRFISIFSDITERKRNEDELRKQRQQLVESETRLRDLAEFLQTVREEERARIARELHDEMGQALTALRIDLGWLRNKCQPLGAPAVERVGTALGVVEHSIVSLRRISEDLRPAMLDSLGLAAAVEHHVTQFSERTGIACRLNMNREEFELDDRLATTVFRIVQETLTNVARHAGASEVTVRIDEVDDGIRLTIQDNGRGISDAKDKKTFGLLGMRERIAMLGGRLEIHSRPGKGTRIAGWLPHQKATAT
ncbi:PAS domain S-box protein [Sulfuritalea sp.]|uniref:PAS domain S-box protein n=1 Tax=Sulfuritalea sp. TaxID=2480090 RepID=UPI00286E0EFC|nr:PAS domain S-box protein [Sulfuritalea sp.]